MIRRIKASFSLLLLATFLLPTVVKEVHSVGHEQRFQCDAQGELHLHGMHHNCTLCDLVMPIGSAPSVDQHDFSTAAFAEYVFPVHAKVFSSFSGFCSALLRAPPAVA